MIRMNDFIYDKSVLLKACTPGSSSYIPEVPAVIDTQSVNQYISERVPFIYKSGGDSLSPEVQLGELNKILQSDRDRVRLSILAEVSALKIGNQIIESYPGTQWIGGASGRTFLALTETQVFDVIGACESLLSAADLKNFDSVGEYLSKFIEKYERT